jgi:hypothetical protein
MTASTWLLEPHACNPPFSQSREFYRQKTDLMEQVAMLAGGKIGSTGGIAGGLQSPCKGSNYYASQPRRWQCTPASAAM